MKTCNCDMGILREQQFGRKRKYFKISPKQAKFWQIHDPGLYYPNCQILEDLGFSFVVPIPLIEWQQMTVIHTVWPFPPLLWGKMHKRYQGTPQNWPEQKTYVELMLTVTHNAINRRSSEKARYPNTFQSAGSYHLSALAPIKSLNWLRILFKGSAICLYVLRLKLHTLKKKILGL